MHRTILITAVTLLLSACAEAREVTSFEECVAVGNPVMESYPRQCRAGDRTFTEVIDEPVSPNE